MNGGGLTVALANSGKGRRFDDGFDLQPSGKVIRVNQPKDIRALMVALQGEFRNAPDSSHRVRQSLNECFRCRQAVEPLFSLF